MHQGAAGCATGCKCFILTQRRVLFNANKVRTLAEAIACLLRRAGSWQQLMRQTGGSWRAFSTSGSS